MSVQAPSCLGQGWQVRLRDVLWPGWEGVRAHGAGGTMAVSGGPGGSVHVGDNEGSAGTRARPVRVSLAPGDPTGATQQIKNKNIFSFKKPNKNQNKQKIKPKEKKNPKRTRTLYLV